MHLIANLEMALLFLGLNNLDWVCCSIHKSMTTLLCIVIAIVTCTRTNQNPRSVATRILVLCPNKHDYSYMTLSSKLTLYCQTYYQTYCQGISKALP
jgi:hypothetical protein